MRVPGFSVWPASVAPLPTRARPKTLTFSMAKILTISMAIDRNQADLSATFSQFQPTGGTVPRMIRWRRSSLILQIWPMVSVSLKLRQADGMRAGARLRRVIGFLNGSGRPYLPVTSNCMG